MHLAGVEAHTRQQHPLPALQAGAGPCVSADPGSTQMAHPQWPAGSKHTPKLTAGSTIGSAIHGLDSTPQDLLSTTAPAGVSQAERDAMVPVLTNDLRVYASRAPPRLLGP